MERNGHHNVAGSGSHWDHVLKSLNKPKPPTCGPVEESGMDPGERSSTW